MIFLWFPYQAVSGIWRAGQPPERRTGIPWLVAAGWACWLLAWVSGVQIAKKAGSIHASVGLYSTLSSRLTLAITAILLILIVRKVSGGPLGDGQSRT